LERELSELREWKADVMESQRAIMSEPCDGTDDRRHCTCVPDLRREIAAGQQRERELRALLLKTANALALEYGYTLEQGFPKEPMKSGLSLAREEREAGDAE
jgi:hypothetical protein